MIQGCFWFFDKSADWLGPIAVGLLVLLSGTGYIVLWAILSVLQKDLCGWYEEVIQYNRCGFGAQSRHLMLLINMETKSESKVKPPNTVVVIAY